MVVVVAEIFGGDPPLADAKKMKELLPQMIERNGEQKWLGRKIEREERERERQRGRVFDVEFRCSLRA